MPLAILLVSAFAGTENTVFESLRNYDSTEVFAVKGEYDFVVKVKADTSYKLKEIITRIKSVLPKPNSILTMFTYRDA